MHEGHHGTHFGNGQVDQLPNAGWHESTEIVIAYILVSPDQTCSEAYTGSSIYFPPYFSCSFFTDHLLNRNVFNLTVQPGDEV